MHLHKVKAYFAGFNLAERIHEFTVSSATVELAAAALGVEPARIAKTLACLHNGKPILIVAAGDARLDNQKFRAVFGHRTEFIPASDTERLIGYAAGGICPFVVPATVRVYLDQSLTRFDYVYPACGSSNSAIKLSLSELAQHAGTEEWLDVCKGWNRGENPEQSA